MVPNTPPMVISPTEENDHDNNDNEFRGAPADATAAISPRPLSAQNQTHTQTSGHVGDSSSSEETDTFCVLTSTTEAKDMNALFQLCDSHGDEVNPRDTSASISSLNELSQGSPSLTRSQQFPKEIDSTSTASAQSKGNNVVVEPSSPNVTAELPKELLSLNDSSEQQKIEPPHAARHHTEGQELAADSCVPIGPAAEIAACGAEVVTRPTYDTMSIVSRHIPDEHAECFEETQTSDTQAQEPSGTATPGSVFYYSSRKKTDAEETVTFACGPSGTKTSCDSTEVNQRVKKSLSFGGNQGKMQQLSEVLLKCQKERALYRSRSASFPGTKALSAAGSNLNEQRCFTMTAIDSKDKALLYVSDTSTTNTLLNVEKEKNIALEPNMVLDETIAATGMYQGNVDYNDENSESVVVLEAQKSSENAPEHCLMHPSSCDLDPTGSSKDLIALSPATTTSGRDNGLFKIDVPALKGSVALSRKGSQLACASEGLEQKTTQDGSNLALYPVSARQRDVETMQSINQGSHVLGEDDRLESCIQRDETLRRGEATDDVPSLNSDEYAAGQYSSDHHPNEELQSRVFNSSVTLASTLSRDDVPKHHESAEKLIQVLPDGSGITPDLLKPPIIENTTHTSAVVVESEALSGSPENAISEVHPCTAYSEEGHQCLTQEDTTLSLRQDHEVGGTPEGSSSTQPSIDLKPSTIDESPVAIAASVLSYAFERSAIDISDNEKGCCVTCPENEDATTSQHRQLEDNHNGSNKDFLTGNDTSSWHSHTGNGVLVLSSQLSTQLSTESDRSFSDASSVCSCTYQNDLKCSDSRGEKVLPSRPCVRVPLLKLSTPTNNSLIPANPLVQSMKAAFEASPAAVPVDVTNLPSARAGARALYVSEACPSTADTGTWLPPSPRQPGKSVYESVAKPSKADATAVSSWSSRSKPHVTVSVRQLRALYEAGARPSDPHFGRQASTASVSQTKHLVDRPQTSSFPRRTDASSCIRSSSEKTVFENIPRPSTATASALHHLPSRSQSRVVFENHPTKSRAHCGTLFPNVHGHEHATEESAVKDPTSRMGMYTRSKTLNS